MTTSTRLSPTPRASVQRVEASAELKDLMRRLKLGRLLDTLPERLGDFRRAPAADPAPPGAAAWRATPDGEAVILRCGLQRPAEFVVGSPLQVVDEVSWFEIAAEAGAGGDPGAGDGRSTWFAVDRPVYVALTLPAGSGPTPQPTS